MLLRRCVICLPIFEQRPHVAQKRSQSNKSFSSFRTRRSARLSFSSTPDRPDIRLPFDYDAAVRDEAPIRRHRLMPPRRRAIERRFSRGCLRRFRAYDGRRCASAWAIDFARCMLAPPALTCVGVPWLLHCRRVLARENAKCVIYAMPFLFERPTNACWACAK